MGCSECLYADLCETLPEDMSCDDVRRYADLAEPDDSMIEMGFDPYLGCYTDDV